MKFIARASVLALALALSAPAFAGGKHQQPSSGTNMKQTTIVDVGVSNGSTSVSNSGAQSNNGGTSGGNKHGGNGGGNTLVVGNVGQTGTGNSNVTGWGW